MSSKSFTTASGVVVEEVTIGSGPEVAKGGAVVAHYRGTLKDGVLEIQGDHLTRVRDTLTKLGFRVKL